MRLSARRRLAPDTVFHPEHRKLHSPSRNNRDDHPAHLLPWLRRAVRKRIEKKRAQKMARKRNRVSE